MPDLDYALLCDFVRADPGGVAHAIGAGIDTLYAAEVPTGHNVGLLAKFTFTQGESGRPHRIELFFRTTDGAELVKIEALIAPEWDETLPPGWGVGAVMGINFGIPLPDYGLYSLEVMIDDRSVKSLQLRVVPPADTPAS
jgi:uncharacterized protein DUF6941